MKILIVSHSNYEKQGGNSPQRFSGMLAALQAGGISAKHRLAASTGDLERAVREEKPDLIFSAAHHLDGPLGKPVNVHAFLEERKLPYIGSTPEALDLALSKPALKKAWQKAGILTPEYFVVSRPEWLKGMPAVLDAARRYPYIVKPPAEGNSRGLSEKNVAGNTQELKAAIERLFSDYNELMVEGFLGGAPDVREFTVAMIGNDAGRMALPVEIILLVKKAVRLVTTGDKNEHRTRAASIDDASVRRAVAELADRAFAIAGVRDYARCDILMAGGRLYALEINGQPMLPDGWFSACAATAGLSETACLNSVFLAGMARSQQEGRLPVEIPPQMKALIPDDVYRRLTYAGEPVATMR